MFHYGLACVRASNLSLRFHYSKPVVVDVGDVGNRSDNRLPQRGGEKTSAGSSCRERQDADAAFNASSRLSCPSGARVTHVAKTSRSPSVLARGPMRVPLLSEPRAHSRRYRITETRRAYLSRWNVQNVSLRFRSRDARSPKRVFHRVSPIGPPSRPRAYRFG